MTKKQVKDYDKFMLRFPDGMRDAIARRAEANGRSMNSEIIQILQDALDGKGERATLLTGMMPFVNLRKGEKGETLLTMDLDKLKELEGKK